MRRLFHFFSFSANRYSFILLVLRIIHIIYLFYVMSALLGKKYLRSPFPISNGLFSVVPPEVEKIKSYYCSASPRSKVLRMSIFPTMNKVTVWTTALSMLVRICRISSGGPDSKLIILNSYVLEVVISGMQRSLILMIFLINRTVRGSILG